MQRLGKPKRELLCALALNALMVGSCSSPPRIHDPGPIRVGSDRIAFPDTPELAEIAQLEYERSTGKGRLLELVHSGEPEVRRRAALALGRMPFPEQGAEVTGALVRALEDEDKHVRRTAAFSLGVRADQEAGGVLAAYRNNPDPLLRVRVAEASRSLDHSSLKAGILLALHDSNMDVRIAAVLAMALWDTESAEADDVDRALIDLLLPPGEPGTEVDPELRWRVLYSLQRRGTALGRGAFLEFAGSGLPLERVFAVRGLQKVPPDTEVLEALSEAAGDPDWRVAVEAVVGLGQHTSPSTLPALIEATESRSAHVRLRAFEALGSFEDLEAVVPPLVRGARDLSPSAQAAALVSLARVLPSADALEHLIRHARDEDGVVRAGVAQALEHLDSADAMPLLRKLMKDADLLVAGSAIQSLGSHPAGEVRELLHAVLLFPDNGLRLLAVLALRDHADPADVAPLGRAIATAKGDIAPEVTFNALTNLGSIGSPEARAIVEEALEHPEPYVRRVAGDVLRDSFGASDLARVDPGETTIANVPLPGRDFPRWEHNPVVEIVTTRGSMVFELFPTETPVHVHNFLTLADANHYDGLVFHRVVPDFVVQGGDYRGDGNGGHPWNGRSLPHEFTTRRYVRGSLGMPRNEDPDSGGSQIFVTHRPTPHLDHRYTIFGELRSGGDVLDRIEMGDRILDVRRR